MKRKDSFGGKMGRNWRLILGVVGLVLVWAFAVGAQGEARLWLGEPDVSAFPLVRVPLHTADSQGAPIADLSALRLRENGIPLDFAVTAVPTGMDIIFVLDATAAFETVDDGGGLTRREKTADAVSQFAGRFMSRDGADRASVIVPDEGGQNGRFLLQNSPSPDILAQTVTAYAPNTLVETPLAAMMALALEQAAQNEDGRFQTILLFTDGGGIHRRLDLDALAAQAGAAHLPIYAAILGARADENEIANVSRLTEPTNGGYVHMPAAEDSGSIFLAWQGQANQKYIEYQSLQTKNGRYPIAVNLGGIRAHAELVLELAAPQIALQLTETEIHRIGAAHDTSLAELDPIAMGVPILVSWPDGVPRPLTAVVLYIGGLDGQTTITTDAQPDAEGRLTIDWDIQLLREGAYQLAVQAADNLGYTAESEPAIVTIFIDRPDPPTPTPIPTPAPTPETIPESPPAIPTERLWLALGLSLLAGLTAAIMLWRRWRARQRSRGAGERGSGGAGEQGDEELPLDAIEGRRLPLADLPLAYLEGDGILLPLTGENMTIGRDETAVQLVLVDKSVSRLHARIRRRDGRYWLYDEGGAAGTRLNFERLGLAPRPLQDGDQIQIGRLRLCFRVGGFEEEE
ncbi:MAG: FHA domain-containing protein [Chloroflexi bacterium]|nr:FHA domain-containing protein [Chloroflexota bacterium]